MSDLNTTDTTSRLRFFPISYFAIIMGLSGFTISWEKSSAAFAIPVMIAHTLLAVTLGLFVVITLLYLNKLIRYRQEVAIELHNPIKLSFFPTVSISLILLSIALLQLAPDLSRVMWMSGTALHLLFTLYVMQVWMHHEHFEIHHMNPAWFIPIVGNILVPIAGVSFGYVEVSTFFFSIGLLFWIVLLAIFFNRIIFHQPLPEKLQPTLFILIAPPAVGFISYVKLAGDVDLFARVLYYFALFLTLLLLTQLPRFTRLKFFLSWWAYLFPMAAITIATIVMFESTGSVWFRGLSFAFLAILTLLVILLAIKTLMAIKRKQICVEEG